MVQFRQYTRRTQADKPLVHFVIYTIYIICIFSLHSESWPIDPSGRTDTLLSPAACWRLQLIMQLAGCLDGSMDRSPGPLQAREAMHHNVSLSEGSQRPRTSEIDAPIDRALFNNGSMGRELDSQLTIDLTTHEMVHDQLDGGLVACRRGRLCWWFACRGDCEIPPLTNCVITRHWCTYSSPGSCLLWIGSVSIGLRQCQAAYLLAAATQHFSPFSSLL